MRIKSRSTVYAYAITLCMGSFIFGYQLTSFSGLIHLLASQNGLEDQETISQMATYFNLILGGGALLGIVAFNYAKKYGWMLCFRVTDLLTVCAGVVGMVDLSIYVHTCSRFLFGLVTGINTIIIPLFLASILPGPMGAPAGTLNQFFIVLGIFTGLCIRHSPVNQSYDQLSWRFIIVIPLLPALIRLHILTHTFPYEPLESYLQTGQSEIIQHYLDRVYQNATVEQFLSNKKLTKEDWEEESSLLCEKENTYYRVRIAVALAIAGLNQFSGGVALLVHLQLQNYSLNTLIWLNLLQLVVTLLAGQLIQKYGRRGFMQEGQRIIIVTLFLIAFIEMVTPQYHYLTLALIFIHMVGYSISYGPCTFLIGTEVVNDIFYPALLQWVIISLQFVMLAPIIRIIGIGGVCLFYCAVQIAAFLFFQSYQVETGGKLRRDVYAEYRNGKYFRNEVNLKEDPTRWVELIQKFVPE